MAIVVNKVNQEELERFQRLCESLELSKKEPNGPTWDAKERVERNVHPHLLSIIDELLDYRAATPTPASSVLVGEGAAQADLLAALSKADEDMEWEVCCNHGGECCRDCTDEPMAGYRLRCDTSLGMQHLREIALTYKRFLDARPTPLSLLGSGDAAADVELAVRRALTEQETEAHGSLRYLAGTIGLGKGSYSDQIVAGFQAQEKDTQQALERATKAESELAALSAAASTGGGAGEVELRRRLDLAGMPFETLYKANMEIAFDRDQMQRQLDAKAVVQWVPVAERSSRDTYEWLFVRLPNGEVESAIFIDDDIESAAWCQWDGDGSYEVMPVQPTHFMPKPNGDLAAAAPQHLVVGEAPTPAATSESTPTSAPAN